ncbi:MAG: hypothetical protein IPG12_11525 [Saprospiraceae bacterium]|nr:hypothetical protein [Saprospiraceae bacterium]
MIQFKYYKVLLLLIGSLVILLEEAFCQAKYLNFSTEELISFAETNIKRNPDSACIGLEDLSNKYIACNKLHHFTICQYYRAKALTEVNRDEDARLLLNLLLKEKTLEDKIDLQYEIHSLLGRIEFQNGHFYRSTVSYRSAMDLAKRLNKDLWIAKTSEELAKIFDKINRSDRAIQFYLRSLKLQSNLNNKEAMQSCALALARLYIGEAKLDSAIHFVMQSINLSKQLNNPTALIESLVEEANVFLKKNDLEKTVRNIQLLDSLIKIASNPFNKVRHYVLIGNYKMTTEGDSVAMIWYNKAEEFSNKGFTPYIDYYIKSNISDAYFSNGQIEKAYSFLKHTNKIGTAYNSKENIELAEDVRQNSELNIRDREIAILQIQNQLKQEKLEQEIQLKLGLKRENLLKDQTLKQEILLNEANAREKVFQHEQLEKEKIISLALLHENEFKKESLQSEQKRQRWLWISILVLLILASLIFYLFKNQKEKNAIILKQAKDLEFINKEVHHRVKNNLQVISSLLDLQSQTHADKNISNLLRESKHRVQSMAFIHQNLYEGEGMNLVDMPNYIQNLIDHLYTAYHRDSENIKIITEISPLRLHMDTVVSIGMIVNELVTNSLKYAFVESKQGSIIVSLKEWQNQLILTVSDDGIGIPVGIDVSTIKSFGYKMIRAFVQKLKAKLIIENEHGTNVQILINKK